MPEDILRELDKVYGIGSGSSAAALLRSVAETRAKNLAEGVGGAFGFEEKTEEKTDVTEIDVPPPKWRRS
jgi:hypothetical protein